MSDGWPQGASIKRLHLFEIEDQTWCPFFIRRGVTDFLAATSRITGIYKSTAPVLAELLKQSPEKKLIVLGSGSGSGGGIMDVLEELPPDVHVILTDLFPVADFRSPDNRVTYYPKPVDALNVPQGLRGPRVIYSAFHHFPPDAAKKIIECAGRDRQPIAIFEGTERSVRGIITTLLIPIIVVLMTPWVRPFRLSRLFWTYVIPLFPIVIFWDGLVSALRTYSLDEMKEMTRGVSGYKWQIENLRGPRGEILPLLAGTPNAEAASGT